MHFHFHGVYIMWVSIFIDFVFVNWLMAIVPYASSNVYSIYR